MEVELLPIGKVDGIDAAVACLRAKPE